MIDPETIKLSDLYDLNRKIANNLTSMQWGIRESYNIEHSEYDDDYISSDIVSVGDDFLEHHGVENMHWGVRNGPPYPLNSSGKAKARKEQKRRNKILSDPKKLAKHINEFSDHEINDALHKFEQKRKVSNYITKDKIKLTMKEKRMARSPHSLKKNANKFSPDRLKVAIEYLKQRQDLSDLQLRDINRANDMLRTGADAIGSISKGLNGVVNIRDLGVKTGIIGKDEAGNLGLTSGDAYKRELHNKGYDYLLNVNKASEMYVDNEIKNKNKAAKDKDKKPEISQDEKSKNNARQFEYNLNAIDSAAAAAAAAAGLKPGNKTYTDFILRYKSSTYMGKK